MNKLTELERELLNSVKALQDGLREEVEQSRASLSSYDQAMSKRLTEIERRLDKQDEALRETFRLLKEMSEASASQLQGFERTLKDLSATVQRYAR